MIWSDQGYDYKKFGTGKWVDYKLKSTNFCNLGLLFSQKNLGKYQEGEPKSWSIL